MSHFITNPVVELIANDNGGLWKVYIPLQYHSDLVGDIVIPKGFITDFASVPRMFFAYMLVGNTAHTASTIHDYLYRKDSVPTVSRDVADSVFKEVMTLTNIPKERQDILYAGVKVGGGGAYHKLNVLDYPTKFKTEEETTSGTDAERDQGTPFVDD